LNSLPSDVQLLVMSGEPGEAGFGVAGTNWDPGFYQSHAGFQGDSQMVYFYTDRPIYRPGDVVYFRGIIRTQNHGRHLPPSLTNLPVEIIHYGETGEETLYIERLGGNDAGIFNGQFTLSENAGLGTYTLRIRGQNLRNDIWPNHTTFRVSDYRKAEFQASLTADKVEALPNEPVEVTGEATYYFGGPAAGMTVR
jgi:uncharacterized protein YfaS (alpha-2-macroglobulin family)